MSKRSRKDIESSDEEYVPIKKRNVSVSKSDDDVICEKRRVVRTGKKLKHISIDSESELSESELSESDVSERESESELSDSFSSLSIDDAFETNYEEILNEENNGKNGHLVKELARITDNIQKGQITLTSILACSLHDHDKETAVELFGILNTCERNSLDYLQLNKLICTMVISDERVNNRYMCDMPTINKILRAAISKEDKLKAIELYNIFYNVSVGHGTLYSEEWYLLQRKINGIINKHRTLEELARLEEKEKEVKACVPAKKDMKTIILDMDASLVNKKILLDMHTEMVSTLDEHTKSGFYDKLTWYTKLPHNKQLIIQYDDISMYCKKVLDSLNESLYGMQEVKEKILLFINNKLRNPNYSSILSLIGSPGTGKSKIVKCLAKAVGLPYNKLSFGGATDSTLIFGGNQMWKNSSPGMMVKLLCTSGCSNPIILLDEIDKLTDSPKGKEVQSALLHVLDKTQNDHFDDSFLCEYPHDLSNVWFIATMNNDEHLDPALKDRMEIIKVPSYNKEELVNIIKVHILPEMCVEHGYKREDFAISDNACHIILNNIKNDMKASGVRKVQEEVKNIVSKISFLDKVGPNEFQLSFKLKQKITFPFMIDESTVKGLMKKKAEPNHLSFYA